MSTERVIVHENIAEELTAAVRNIASSFKAGDTNTDRSVKLGPLFSTKSADRLVGVLNDAKGSGAEIILGDLSNKEAVVQPHIIKGVKPGMKIWDEESFGPGISVLISEYSARISLVSFLVIVFATFTTVDEAIELANASKYSLTSSVWSTDIPMAQEVAFQMRYSEVVISFLQPDYLTFNA
jgi:acyl-CoA reductase-like NAD-dependent aldehyde dehydrogenase